MASIYSLNFLLEVDWGTIWKFWRTSKRSTISAAIENAAELVKVISLKKILNENIGNCCVLMMQERLNMGNCLWMPADSLRTESPFSSLWGRCLLCVPSIVVCPAELHFWSHLCSSLTFLNRNAKSCSLIVMSHSTGRPQTGLQPAALTYGTFYWLNYTFLLILTINLAYSIGI